MSILLENFLIRNNYTSFNRKDVSLQLRTHPNNPSFRAMTDTLDYFGIENVAANVPEEALEVLPKDFLTIVEKGNPKLVLATKKKDVIFTLNEEGKKTRYSWKEFLEIWSKDIIAIEKTTEKNNFQSLKSYWLVIPLVILTIFLYVEKTPISQISRIVFAAIGIWISYLLVKEKMGYHSPFVNNVCTALPNSNCNDVINSKGGNIFKEVSLADASFLYFFVVLFSTVFLKDNFIVTALLLLALPIILFSLYYQGFILKKWCMLCIGVVLILGLLNITLLWGVNLEFSYIEIVEFLLLVSILLPAYFYLKNLIEISKKNNQEIIESRRFKRNPETVKNIMKDAKTVDDIVLFENEIIIGNRNSIHQIITYTNPLCGFCKKAFESYMKIIGMNPNIKIIMRFITDSNDLTAHTTLISCRLTEIYYENGAERFINSYISWFKDKDVDGWLKKYHKPKCDNDVISLLKSHKLWAEMNEITYTPATIITGKIFPSSYGYEDLVYVINDIIEVEVDEKETIKK